MSQIESKPSTLDGPAAGESRGAVLSPDPEVDRRPLFPDQSLPILIQPKAGGLRMLEWARGNRDRIEQDLLEHGGILFRGFEVGDLHEFEQVIEAVADGALEYKERSSPRSRVEGNVYTSTDYPASQPIFLHNENSYQHAWPMKIFFHCVIEPTERGETPIADTRRVFQRVPPAIRRKFAEKGWCYVRNFGGGLGLDWQTVFQTSERSEVQDYCRSKGIEVEWLSGDRLRTRAVRPAMARHPKTGEPVWFNHATFFHVSTLTPEVREPLLEFYDEEDLPSNTYYGDGTPIEAETLDELRRLYNEETVMFPWRKGDLMLLDNMMVAHGRSPYSGERKIVVGMAEPRTWDETDHSVDPAS